MAAETAWGRAWPILIMLLACSMFAASTMFAKLAGPSGAGLHPLQVSAGRFLFALLPIAVMAAVAGTRMKTALWTHHVARTVFGWLGVSSMFAAAAVLSLSAATALSFLFPVIGMVLAILFLGERAGAWRWGAAMVSVLGALLVTNPGAEAIRPAALLGLASACFIGCETLFTKRLAMAEPVLRTMLYNSGLGTLIGGTAAAFVWQMPSAEGWGLLAAVGLSMATGQVLYIFALRRAAASHLLPLFYTTLLFATLYDWVLFAYLPGWVAALGMAMIAAGAAVIAWRQARQG